jgi:hypothetical protein
MHHFLSRKCIHYVQFYTIALYVTFFSFKLVADPVPSSYVAYSIEDLIIGDRAGTNSAGLIGSQANIFVGSDAIVNGSIYANGKIYLNDRSITTGTVVSGDSVIRGFNISAGSIVQHANVEQYTIPVKNITIGTSDFTVPLDGNRTLEPGSYKDVTVMERGVLTLQNGVYNVNTFIIGNDTRLILDYPPNGNVEINVKTTLTLGDRVKMSFLNDSNSYAIRFYADGTDSCVLGYEGILYGNFTVPNAKLTLHDRTKFTGTLYAKKLELQPSIYSVIDTIFPSIQLVTPVPGSTIGTPQPRIVLYFSDNRAGLEWSTLQINLNGSDVTPDFTIVNDSAIWQIPQIVALPEGPNTISADIFDRAGNGTQVVKTFSVDGTAPVVAIQDPQNGFITNQQNIPVSWTVDGVSQNTQASASLQEGLNTVTRSSTDQFGRTGSASVHVTLDTQVPVIAITSPVNGTVTNQSEIAVAWTVDGVAQTTELTASLTEGENTITRSYTDAAGNIGTASVLVTLDTQVPVVAITSPVNGTITNQSEIAVAWTVDGVAQTTELIASLTEGENTITRSFTDAAGNIGTASVLVTLDTQVPIVAITTPVNGMITNQSELAVGWTVDGVAQTTELTASITEGENTITRSYTDAAGNIGTASVQVTLDTQVPVVAITSPVNGTVTNQSEIAVAWTVDGVAQTTELTASLTEGENTITRSYTDAAGNIGTASVHVTLDTQVPVIAFTSPVNGTVTNQSEIAVAWTVDGVAQTTELIASLTEGENTITRSFTDAAGNIGTASVLVTLDTQVPIVAITTPVNGMITNQSEISVAWTVDGVAQTTELIASLTEGENTITRSYTDAAGNTGTASIQVALDTQKPVVIIVSPVENAQLPTSPVSVIWTVDGITQNQQNSENLIIGQNRIIRTATDPAGNIGADTVTVYLDESCITISNTTLTIGSDDHSYDNRSLCINNSTVNIIGYHPFRDITLNRSTIVADTGFTARDLLLTVSSTLTHPETNIDTVYGLKITANTVNIDATSSINVNGRGYVGDRYVNGVWRGARTAGNLLSYISGHNDLLVCGGTHGGTGSRDENIYSKQPIPVYDNVFAPTLPGSGGGADTSRTTNIGGDGGGVIYISASKIEINGKISANGLSSTGYEYSYIGGGAGGSIWLNVDSISGSGKIEANGGVNSLYRYHRPGAGGIIFIDAADLFDMNIRNVTTVGSANTNAQPARNGTSIIRDVSIRNGKKILIVNPSKVAGSDVVNLNDTLCYDSRMLFVLNSKVLATGENNFDSVVCIRSDVQLTGNSYPYNIDLDSSSSFTAHDGLSIDSMTIADSCILEIGGILQIEKLQIGNNGTVRHKKSGVDSVYMFDIAANTIIVEAGGSIDVSGLGYVGDRNVNGSWRNAHTFGNIETQQISSPTHTYVCGGSHGGIGGTYSGVPNAIYGSELFPKTHGGGGGANRSSTGYFGGDGGGVIQIQVNNLELNGTIKSNGVSVTGLSGGGGAGGSVFIFAENITGTGTIEARGGTGISSGGGGRIALYNCSAQNLVQTNVTGNDSGTVYSPCYSNNVQIVKPLNGEYLNENPAIVFWYSNGNLNKDSDALTDGWNTIIRGDTILGTYFSDTVNVFYDTIPPVVQIVQPATDTVYTNVKSITIRWEINGQLQSPFTRSLISGINKIECRAIDSAGNTGSDIVFVIYDSKAPVVTIHSPLNGAVVTSDTIPVIWSVDGDTQTTETYHINAPGSKQNRTLIYRSRK